MPHSTYVAECDVGRGLFAARPFIRGERIVVFRGTPVAAGDPIHYTPDGANLLQVGTHRYIYPRARAVFVNHSCKPNAGMRGTVTLVALRAIAADEEIRFDYSTTMAEDLWTMECRCGEPQCRGLVRDFRHLPATLRSRYMSLGIVPKFIARGLSVDTRPHRPGGRARTGLRRNGLAV